jgi:hypothetical protein
MVPADIWAAEAAFQVANIVDLQQTLDIKHHKRAYESADVFDGGSIIGERPRDPAIYAYLGAEGILHAGVSLALARWSPWTARAWEAGTLSVKILTIRHNAGIGLQIRF